MLHISLGGVASKWKCCTKTAEYLSSNDDHIVVGAPEDYFNEGDLARDKKKQQSRLAELQSESYSKISSLNNIAFLSFRALR